MQLTNQQLCQISIQKNNLQNIKLFACCAIFQLTALSDTWKEDKRSQERVFKRPPGHSITWLLYHPHHQLLCFIYAVERKHQKKVNNSCLVALPPSFPMCGGGGGKISWSLFIYYCQPAGLDRLLENAPSEFLKFWLLLNRFYILARKPRRQAGECIGGQRGGGRW